jgi:hypothetical protein
MHTIAHAASAATSDQPHRPLPRWGARAAVAAPVAAVIAVVVGAPLYADDLSEAAATSRFAVANTITLGVLLLLGLTLVGTYMHCERRLGALGHAGFLVALAGVVLAAAAHGTRCSPSRGSRTRRRRCSTSRPAGRCLPGSSSSTSCW